MFDRWLWKGGNIFPNRIIQRGLECIRSEYGIKNKVLKEHFHSRNNWKLNAQLNTEMTVFKIQFQRRNSKFNRKFYKILVSTRELTFFWLSTQHLVMVCMEFFSMTKPSIIHHFDWGIWITVASWLHCIDKMKLFVSLSGKQCKSVCKWWLLQDSLNLNQNHKPKPTTVYRVQIKNRQRKPL